jgi:lysozyme
MRTNEAGLRIIKESEGCELTAYRCPAGIWTVGWGSTGADVREGMAITAEQAEARLLKDVARAEEAVRSMVSVPLNENQFSALVSLVFNLGSGKIRFSTLINKLNVADYQGAANEFPRWVYAGGRKLAGLELRREKERSLFLTPVEV